MICSLEGLWGGETFSLFMHLATLFLQSHSSMLDRNQPLGRLRSPERGRQRGRDGERAVLRHGARHALRVHAARQRKALGDVPVGGRSVLGYLGDILSSEIFHL